MDYMSVRDEIKQLILNDDYIRAGEMEGILEAYPDSHGVRGPYGDFRVCSETLNPDVDHLELEHQALIHDDCPLRVWFYAVVGKHDRIFSEPPCFAVAEANHAGFGEIPCEGWEQELRLAKIGERAIMKLKLYLERHPPVDYTEDDT